jgi:dTDP-L-rhamnose 4-epimerase
MKRSVLILGGAGFIGTRLAKRLVDAGHDVTVVDNLSYQVHMGRAPDVAEMPIRFVQADCKVEGWASQVAGLAGDFDSIVHLVAETGTGQSMYQAFRYCRTNVDSMALLSDMLVPLSTVAEVSGAPAPNRASSETARFRAERVIVASSRAVYGDAILDSRGAPQPSREDDVVSPRSIYAVTKLAQEHLLFAGFHGIQKCAIRFQNVYGEGQSLTNPYTGVASAFVAAALDGRSLQVYSDGQMSRDFVHVEDAVSALMLCVESADPPPEIVNVGTGRPTTILQLAEAIVSLSGSKSGIEISGGEILGDIRHNFADTSLAQAFGFQAKVELDQGLLRLIGWAKDADRSASRLLSSRARNELLAHGVLR